MSVVNPVSVRRYKLFNQTIFKIISTKYYNCLVLFKIFKFTKYNYNRLSLRGLLSWLTKSKENLLYLDHSLGGGTALYSFNKVQELSKKYNVIVCQYDAFLKKYIFSNDVGKICCATKKIPGCILGCVQKIVINNLVGYKNTPDILNIVTNAKNNNIALSIDVMVHDYYCVCPTVHLIKPDVTTCVMRDCVVCTKCQKNIGAWRNTWKNFLTNVVDSVTVFSRSSKKILLSVYPELDSKIKIVPHVVEYVHQVKIKKHNGINIAIVGSLYSIKGQKLVCEMLSFLPKHVKIIHIGQFYGVPPQHPQFICAGPYDLQSLPDIVEKYMPDIAFIPSIVPETFSFTTSECMQMGLPVACFNIGAPVERVSKYDKGLVISKIDPRVAVREILEFIKHKADK